MIQPVSLVAILNVTPDSFFDGGKWQSTEQIVVRAQQCMDQGANIIEIGGQSTGPGSIDVSLDEELRRVIPAIEALRKALPDARIAIDTFRAEVARRAIDAGATMVNDVLAGRGDAQMFDCIASARCEYVMMYSKDSSARTTKADKRYADVIGTIHTFLADRRAKAMAAGISPERIIVDPGLGHFVSSDPKYSWQILRSLEAFADLGTVFVSPSRKSFLAGPQNLPVADRLPATLAATAVALEHGASYIRTHDVLETRRVMDVL